MSGIVVVGAGQAGQSLVETLRAQNYDGAITIIGEEPVAPYQRPPLSKDYLLGNIDFERLRFRDDSYYTERNIVTRWGVRVEAVDTGARRLSLSDGSVIGYDKLALTTGARARKFPADKGGDLDGVHSVRTVVDVDALSIACRAGGDLVIIGGGYIGLEAAAVAQQRGLNVTLVEAADRLLERVAARETSEYFRQLHEAHGVKVRTGVGLSHFAGEGRVETVVLADGSIIPTDFVILGIGVIPNAELAESAGLAIDNGIAVDASCRTSDAHIFAAGDCASFPFSGAGGATNSGGLSRNNSARRIRLESVQNALHQGAIAARAMLGQEVAYMPVPWFWSDQYDVKLQIAGLSAGYDKTIVRPGKRDTSRSVWYFAGDQFLAVDAMNDPRAYMTAKRMLESGRLPAPAVVGDPDWDLKT